MDYFTGPRGEPDPFGNGANTQAHRINEAMTVEFQTLEQIARRCKIDNRDRLKAHMRFLVEHGHAKRHGQRWALTRDAANAFSRSNASGTRAATPIASDAGNSGPRKMAAWRMSFRVGTKGQEFWPRCHDLGVAAIEYIPVDDLDLSRFPQGEPTSAWSQLAPTQSASLRRFVHEMAVGNVIYVKQGPKIVGKGVITSEYQFVRRTRLRASDGTPWQHQRRVAWMRTFSEVRIQVGKSQQFAVDELSADDVARIEQEQPSDSRFADESAIEGTKTEVVLRQSKRSRRLRQLAFDAAHGVCCVCGRDFSMVLGGLGVRVLQVHHRDQLSSHDAPTVTKVRDLAVVCANCHLLLHLDPQNSLTVEALREMLEADGFLAHDE